MPFNIRSDAVNRLAEAGAPRLHSNKLLRLDQAVPLRERLRPIRDRIRARPATGLAADKAFHDERSGAP